VVAIGDIFELTSFKAILDTLGRLLAVREIAKWLWDQAAHHPLGIVFLIVGVTLLWTDRRALTFRRVLRIEDWAVNNALNLRITNVREKQGFAESQLRLHSIKRWEPGRGQFCAVPIFPKLPVGLTNDHNHLPYKVPRMFQLAEFVDASAPGIRGVLGGHEVLYPLPSRGIWELSMELRWAGGNMPIVRYFNWADTSLPVFCEAPH
jgi:hypothetical protein